LGANFFGRRAAARQRSGSLARSARHSRLRGGGFLHLSNVAAQIFLRL